MLAIYKKEMKGYFHSIIGYLFIGFFLFIAGLYLFIQNMYGQSANFAYGLYGVRLFFMLLIPMITMRIMAEENHQKTDQLLFTSPVSVGRIIMGKFLAIVTMFTIVMAIICAYPLMLKQYGNVNLKAAYVGILAFYLMGCAYLAIGMFISSITENQAFAAILTFVVVLITSFAAVLGQLLPDGAKTAVWVFSILAILLAFILYLLLHNYVIAILLGCIGEAVVLALYFIKPSIYDRSVTGFFNWLTIGSRLNDFAYGVCNVSALVYYVTVTFLFVFLTVQAVKKRRWS